MGTQMRRTRGGWVRMVMTGILSVCVWTGLSADRIELMNGDVITGTIQLMDSESVVIETDYGILEIDRSAVLRGSFGRPDGDVHSGLLFHLPLNGDIVDSTGTYQVTNNGMRFVADVSGLPQSAARSDGTGTYISIASSEELDALDQFTIAFDLKLESLSGTQYLVSKWRRAEGETADGKFTVQSSGGDITMFVVAASGAYSRIIARAVLGVQTWHAVALTFAGGRAYIYVDGVEVAAERFSFTGLFQDTSPVLVMTAEAQAADTYGYYNPVGTVDEVRFYGRALAPDEVAALAARN
ncbi:MAG: LamG domain-containing protein [Spirochaetales bacterium]|nr:MAG: LamG domain-containing protein [Spirochaetales bacterium]